MYAHHAAGAPVHPGRRTRATTNQARLCGRCDRPICGTTPASRECEWPPSAEALPPLAAPPAPAAPPPRSPLDLGPAERPLQVGDTVIPFGLKNQDVVNGARGVIVQVRSDGRMGVHFEELDLHGAIRTTNLRLVHAGDGSPSAGLVQGDALPDEGPERAGTGEPGLEGGDDHLRRLQEGDRLWLGNVFAEAGPEHFVNYLCEHANWPATQMGHYTSARMDAADGIPDTVLAADAVRERRLERDRRAMRQTYVQHGPERFFALLARKQQTLYPKHMPERVREVSAQLKAAGKGSEPFAGAARAREAQMRLHCEFMERELRGDILFLYSSELREILQLRAARIYQCGDRHLIVRVCGKSADRDLSEAICEWAGNTLVAVQHPFLSSKLAMLTFDSRESADSARLFLQFGGDSCALPGQPGVTLGLA
eukprot:TRINITY_DN19237_c0_g1_i1.p1 TRINITY_DN19237_c0_g1~~TRINITY_DN19237_c0_g1_i1.p1  ORF type:complete len:425 (+),score=60.71 TRINITY_DN19237_c0_g1_i1:80-1354(+)